MLKRYLYCLVVCTVLASVVSLPAVPETPSGEEIMKRVDENRFYEKIEYKGRMTIKKGKKIRTKLMHVYAEGEEKALIEFTNPEDRGTRYLKLHDEMWIYFPEAEDEVKISGHMLKQSMMGSDFSYEDALENKKLLEKYSVTVVGSEIVGDKDKRNCYVLELNATEKDVSYAKRKSWVDKETFVVLKAQLFALSGKLLKEIVMENVRKYGDRYFAAKAIMMDKLMKDSSTTFEMEEINFNVDIPDGTFSRRRLGR